jgi:hypothetical protein
VDIDAKGKLTFYVTDSTPSSARALETLKLLRGVQPPLDIELAAVDVLAEPRLAEAAGVQVTPMAILETGLSTERILGGFSESEKLVARLRALSP